MLMVTWYLDDGTITDVFVMNFQTGIVSDVAPHPNTPAGPWVRRSSRTVRSSRRARAGFLLRRADLAQPLRSGRRVTAGRPGVACSPCCLAEQGKACYLARHGSRRRTADGLPGVGRSISACSP